jgi:hypothetical protein
MFDMMKQSYLLSSNWLNDLVSQAEGVDPSAKRRVEFFTKMLTDAFSPSNFLISNPAALREVMQSKGESLVRGMENFAADLERGGGQLAISQTDLAKFKVGENVATAPGKVVYQNDILQLLQFAPTTETARDPAADLPAVDQQVLHPGPAPRELDDPLADRPGLHGVRRLLGQSRQPPGRQDLRGLHVRGHLRRHPAGDDPDRRR